MPRQRMIKPDFFDSESLAKCSREARLVFVGMWVTADDNGNQKANLRRMRVNILPFDDDVDDAAFGKLLCELESVGCTRGYEVDGERYISVPNFKAHQTIRKPSKTTIPEPPEKVENDEEKHLVRTWYGTSDAPVRHKYATSDPKEVSKEVSSSTLTGTAAAYVVETGTAGVAGAGGECPAPRSAKQLPKAAVDMIEQNRLMAEFASDAVPCPDHLRQGGAA